MARLKDIDLSPIPVKEVTNLYFEWIFLAWMVCFQIRQSRNLPFVSYKSCIYIHVGARERAREQSKERSGVRVKTESETGKRHTSHGRVKPNCLARKSRSCHLSEPILRKV